MLALWFFTALASAIQCPPGTQLQKISDPPQTWCATAVGTKHGPFESRHANGRVRTQGNYVNGVSDGAYARYSEEGRLVERGAHKRGKMNGKWEHFDEDGALKDQTYWKDGVPEGPFEFYFPNGKKKISGRYANGELSGKWSEWDAQGRLANFGEYQCGNRVGAWTLTENRQARQELYSSLGCGSNSRLLLFRGDFVTGIDDAGVALTTGAVSWVPRFSLLSWFSLRPRLGGSIVKVQGASGNSPALLADLWLEFSILKWVSFGAGGGLQWVESNGVTVGAGSNFSFPMHWKALPFWKAIVLSHTSIFAQPHVFHWIALGADFGF